MDEWPELEALGRALDAWDEWPVQVHGLLDGSPGDVIAAARVVVENYRTQKAAIEHYRNMPPITMAELRMQGLMTEEQYRRQVGLPPTTKACIEVPVPPGYDEDADLVVRHARKVWDDFGQAMQSGHPMTSVPREGAGGDRPRDD